MRSCDRCPVPRARQLARCGLLAVLLGGCQTGPPPQEVEPPPEPAAPAADATPAAPEQTVTSPADASSAAQSTATAPPAAAGTTPEERVQALDRELETSYESHDAMLRDHQVRGRAEAAEIAAQQTAGDGGDPDKETFEQGGLYEGLPGFGAPPPTSGGREEGDGAAASAEDDRSAAPAAAGGAPRGQTGGATIPADIPDGRDDDIVARQLREAAQMEQDPELRKKLWDEYRKYKNRQAAQ